jgi:hypothetical protein
MVDSSINNDDDTRNQGQEIESGVVVDVDNACDFIEEETNDNQVRKKIKRITCCACDSRRNKANPNVSFSRVPFSKQRPLKTFDDDEKRLTYYKRIETRRLFLERLGLSVTDSREHLMYCNKHVLEGALVIGPNQMV